MATNLPTYGLNQSAVSTRTFEVPAADFSGGMNKGGSNAPGVGINTGNIDPKLTDWSVQDQNGLARDPQATQHIGGGGLGAGDQAAFAVNAVQNDGADVNDTLTYIEALAQAAPGVGFGAGNADPINRTDVTIEIGDRAWGTNTVV